MKRFKSFSFFFLLLLSCFCYANPVADQASMLQTLDYIKNEFDLKYAPTQWKKEFFGWSIKDQIEQAKKEVKKNKLSIADFQRLVARIFHSARDFHVSVSFCTTEMAFLPFRIREIGGSYYVSWVYKSSDAKGPFFPLNVGDQLLSFDGKAIEDVIEELNFFESVKSETSRRMLEFFLTHRMALLGYAVPQGSVEVVVKDAKTQKVNKCLLEWLYFPEEINSEMRVSQSIEETKVGVNTSLVTLQRAALENQLAPSYEKMKLILAPSSQDGEGLAFWGSKKSYLPDLGKITWKSSETVSFHAYIYKNAKNQSIGYIRIPHFTGEEKEVEEFEKIIKYFSKNTHALVIDILQNSGGYDIYRYALSSMLTNAPLINFKERLMITQKEVLSAIAFLKATSAIATDEEAKELLGDTLLGYPINLEFVKDFQDYYQFVVDQWNQRKFFTEPYYEKLKCIQPHAQVNYEKPILILVDNLSLSAADYFPAQLQDNGRATIMGSQTAGAGGGRSDSTFTNRLGIEQFSLTGSITERLNGQPLENLGVTPDIKYEITLRDLQEGYIDFALAIQKAVDDLIK